MPPEDLDFFTSCCTGYPDQAAPQPLHAPHPLGSQLVLAEALLPALQIQQT